MTIETRKYQLIEGIMKVTDEAMLKKLEGMLSQYHNNFDSIQHIAKPIKKKLDIDQLVKDKNYKGVDKSKVDNLIDEMGLDTPIEELIDMI